MSGRVTAARIGGDGRVVACVEVGGSGIQTVVFTGDGERFVDGIAVPEGAVVGVAAPGHIEGGRVAHASSLGWTDVDPATRLGLASAPALVCNDAEAAALGEWLLRGRVDAALVYIGIGTGIGGAVVDGGAVTHANLFGHQPGFGSRRCACGRRGCLETVAGGWAMPEQLDTAAVATAARAIARAVRAEPAAGRGVVVIAGGVPSRYPALVGCVAAALPDRIVVASARPPQAKSAAAWGVRTLLARAAGTGVDLRVGRDPRWCAVTAADLIEHAIAGRTEIVLGVATGSTPLATYAELARRGTNLSTAWIYLLDEYVGLPRDDPRSYLATIRAVFVDRFGISPARVRGPDPDAGDLVVEGHRYDAEIAARGGIDLQLLGIGRNGHIGFNEPGSPFDSASRPVQLTDTTRSDNARFFESVDAVPRTALTQGISTIMRARAVLLLATGRAKAAALAATLAGPISPAVPASAIRLHPRAVVVADRAAAAALPARLR